MLRPLSEVASAHASIVRFDQDAHVWHLTLDQIESGTGKLLNRSIKPASEAGSSTFVFDTGNVLYSKLRPYLNKVFCPDMSGVATTELVPLRPMPGLLDRNYLCQYLRSQQFVSWASAQVDGAKMPRMNLKIFWAHKIPLPPLQDQIRIAHLLEKVEALIAKRKEDLAQLDVFLKSVFLEMFGDPVQNEKGWEKKTAIDYADCIVPGRDKPKSFSGEIPWITTNDLMHLGTTMNSKLNLGLTTKEISDSKARLIPAQSVILTCVGDLGVVSICGQDAVINQQLHAFVIKDTTSQSFYMFALSFQKDYMYQYASQTTLPYMNKTICNGIPMIHPPLALQNQFAGIVEKVERLKAKYQQSLTDLESLYATLSQKAFAGELDLKRVKV